MTNQFPLNVPKEIAICPYCDKPLVVYGIEALEYEPDGRKVITEIDMQCVSAQKIGIKKYVATHTDMPYVYWMPVDLKVIKWLNQSTLDLSEFPDI